MGALKDFSPSLVPAECCVLQKADAVLLCVCSDSDRAPGRSQPGESDVVCWILQTFLNWKEARLTWSFFKQSFLKQILTEGEAGCAGVLGKGK